MQFKSTEIKLRISKSMHFIWSHFFGKGTLGGAAGWLLMNGSKNWCVGSTLAFLKWNKIKIPEYTAHRKSMFYLSFQLNMYALGQPCNMYFLSVPYAQNLMYCRLLPRATQLVIIWEGTLILPQQSCALSAVPCWIVENKEEVKKVEKKEEEKSDHFWAL